MIARRPFSHPASLFLTTLLASLAGCSSTPSENVGTGAHADTASVGSMVACPADNSDPQCPAGSFAVTCKDGSHEVDTVAQIQTDQSCVALNSFTGCQLNYANVTTCPGNSCPTLTVDSFGQTTQGSYPSFQKTLGNASAQTMPYSASASATPKPAGLTGATLKTDGYFNLGILDNAGGQTFTSQAEVSLSRLGKDPGDIEAGDLRATVPDFVYQGQTYNFLEVLCYIVPAPVVSDAGVVSNDSGSSDALPAPDAGTCSSIGSAPDPVHVRQGELRSVPRVELLQPGHGLREQRRLPGAHRLRRRVCRRRRSDFLLRALLRGDASQRGQRRRASVSNCQTASCPTQCM